MNTTESISTPDDREAGGAPLADHPTQVAKRPGLWLAILLRVLGILAIIYFVPE